MITLLNSNTSKKINGNNNELLVGWLVGWSQIIPVYIKFCDLQIPQLNFFELWTNSGISLGLPI